MQHEQMQQHPMHLGGRRCALPPNPPPAFFIFKDDSSHRHTSLPRTARRNKKHKNKEKNGRTKQEMQHEQMQQHPMHLGGRRCSLPPNPPPAFLFLRMTPLTATPLPRTARRTKKHKNKEKNGRTKQDMQHEQMQQHLMHLGGRRCALPPNPPPAFFIFKDDASHRHTSLPRTHEEPKNIRHKN